METKINKLKAKLQKIGTRDLLGMIGIHFITFANNAKEVAEQSDIFNKTNLVSPQKQYAYLAGLLMSTNDESNGQIIRDEDGGIFEQLESDVQEITNEYLKNFLDIDQNSEKNVVKRNLISMEATWMTTYSSVSMDFGGFKKNSPMIFQNDERSPMDFKG